jgi:2-oxoglutarate dehydrogenase E2 component (dihydrolipoamide succinyltransferase)
LRAAREHGISLDELEKIPATGAGGRLSKRDLECYLEKRNSSSRKCSMSPPRAVMATESEVERVKMSGMRKAIADNMVKSFYQAPHATLVAEVDVTEAIRTIQREKENFLAKHGVKLTITSFTARAIANALQEFPLINSSLDQDTIVVKRYVNLGIAVSVDQGLLVPVIKNCQRLTLPEIAKAVSELSVNARSGKLSPADVQDGTITMTNFGMSGVHIGIPIIRYPEVAIVGMGAVHKKVVAFEDDTFGVRSMMNICLTFDHRVLDGMYGCGFLGALKKHLETSPEV